MKTIRTILATFGVTSLFYGLFALISMRLNPAFTGRSIYQLFRDTGFVALVIGIGCVLSFVIMTIAIVSFRDDGARKKREYDEDDPDDFLEEETVPEERAEEADETWPPEIKRKQRRALLATDEDEEVPNLFDDEDEAPRREPFARPEVYTADEPETPVLPIRETAAEAFDEDEPEEAPADAALKRCIYCGKPIDADSAFCIYCGKRV
jgi:hypothetical protein